MGKRGRERAESRERAQDRGRSQPRLEGDTHEWLVVGGTREDQIMNGCPRMATGGILIELFQERTLCAQGG